MGESSISEHSTRMQLSAMAGSGTTVDSGFDLLGTFPLLSHLCTFQHIVYILTTPSPVINIDLNLLTWKGVLVLVL